MTEMLELRAGYSLCPGVNEEDACHNSKYVEDGDVTFQRRKIKM
jgi:hypothetical protein